MIKHEGLKANQTAYKIPVFSKKKFQSTKKLVFFISNDGSEIETVRRPAKCKDNWIRLTTNPRLIAQLLEQRSNHENKFMQLGNYNEGLCFGYKISVETEIKWIPFLQPL